MTEIIIKVEENSPEKEEERVLIKKMWDYYACDGKLTYLLSINKPN